MGGLTSAASFIALLDEEQPELKVFALEKLNSLVDEFWPEIASEIQKVYVHSCVYEGGNVYELLFSVKNYTRMRDSHVGNSLPWWPPR